MGQQQLLLITLGVIIIAIAIAVGLLMFGTASVGSNKDALINDVAGLAANACQYRLRITAMGGGGGSFAGYTIPARIVSNDNGTLAVVSATRSTIVFCATSALGYGSITTTVDSSGSMSNFTYTGEF